MKLLSLALFALLSAFFSPSLASAQEDEPAQATSEKTIQSTLDAAEKARLEKRYDDALSLLGKALVLLRRKPLFRKLPVYMSMGVSLYRKGQTGLAWKAFEQALYQFPCAQLSNAEAQDAEMKEIVERIRQRVLRRGGLQERAIPCANLAEPSPPPSTSSFSPWPWLVTAVAAGTLTAGVILLLNASSMRSQIDTWSQSALARGYKNEEITSLALPTRSASDSQTLAGIICLATSGVALASAITLFVVLRPSTSPSPSASAFPSSSSSFSDSSLPPAFPSSSLSSSLLFASP